MALSPAKPANFVSCLSPPCFLNSVAVEGGGGGGDSGLCPSSPDWPTRLHQDPVFDPVLEATKVPVADNGSLPQRNNRQIFFF